MITYHITGHVSAPFFKLRFGPEHRTDAEAGPELPGESLPEGASTESDSPFVLRLPAIDLSDIFRPLKVFAGGCRKVAVVYFVYFRGISSIISSIFCHEIFLVVLENKLRIAHIPICIS